LTKHLPILVAVFFIQLPVQAQYFSDIAEESGIIHYQENIMEMGGGAVFFDYDGDGDDDLYASSGQGTDKLYRNNGDGSFTDVTINSGLEITGSYYTTGATSGDIDNDGDRDLIVFTWFSGDLEVDGVSRDLLFINDGAGNFSEEGIARGISSLQFSMGATFLDYDLDGLLDLYIISHIKEMAADSPTGIQTCWPNVLYHNTGNGVFTDVTEDLNATNIGCGLGVVATDHNKDGYPDLQVVNDFGLFVEPNAFLIFDPDRNVYLDEAPSLGADLRMYAMGIGCADYDLDGDFDYYITNIGQNALLENNGDLTYSDIALTAGVDNSYTPENLNGPNAMTTGWGTAFIDYNNDLFPDLFVANGRVDPQSSLVTGEFDPNKLYLNNKDGTFSDITTEAGVGDLNRGRGLEGTVSNRDAYGARLEAYIDDIMLQREVYGGSSHASQNSTTLHFGLENYAGLDSVLVYWPSGFVQTIEALNGRIDLSANQTINIIEPSSVLPVELVSFSSENLSSAIQLNWVTASETNNKGFELQRSTNIISGFENIAWVPAQGAGNYMFVDEEVDANVSYYYKLKQIDNNGASSYSNTIRAELIQEAQLKVLSNPIREQLYISLPKLQNSATLTIWSINGQARKRVNIAPDQTTLTLTIPELIAGTYMIEIRSGNQRWTDKFIEFSALINWLFNKVRTTFPRILYTAIVAATSWLFTFN